MKKQPTIPKSPTAIPCTPPSTTSTLRKSTPISIPIKFAWGCGTRGGGRRCESPARRGRGKSGKGNDVPIKGQSRRISAINDDRVTQTGLSTNQENVLLKADPILGWADHLLFRERRLVWGVAQTLAGAAYGSSILHLTALPLHGDAGWIAELVSRCHRWSPGDTDYKNTYGGYALKDADARCRGRCDAFFLEFPTARFEGFRVVAAREKPR
jgi:hypothetical protein